VLTLVLIRSRDFEASAARSGAPPSPEGGPKTAQPQTAGPPAAGAELKLSENARAVVRPTEQAAPLAGMDGNGFAGGEVRVNPESH
jgi:hypothetical protein